MSSRVVSVVIENVQPRLDSGDGPVKRVQGEGLHVSADIFKEGHDVLFAAVRWRQESPAAAVTDWAELPLAAEGNDRWTAFLPTPTLGRIAFTIEAWADAYATWVSELKRRIEVNQTVRSELLEGAELLRRTAERAQSPIDAERFRAVAQRLQQGPTPDAINGAIDTSLVNAASSWADRSRAASSGEPLSCLVERERARTGAWYELFPRSAARDGKRHGTFADVEALLPEIQLMGFDVLYLPPIHPIGRTARRGKNNSPTAAPNDVGSPWAIGAAEGGHKAIHPQLGTLEDFKRLIRRSRDFGLEVALDIAFQCSPDHPYLRQHPEWFQRRPDGTIKAAENPPKRYDDIVNFDFWPAKETLWPELKSIVQYWIDVGVKIFRVDNPHTKPVPFWVELIRDIQSKHPDVVFLAEAFTRPKVMKALAKAGFSQSYTYFTWRTFKQELEDYLNELNTSPVAEYFRPNFWPNTPDILPEILQHGGPPAFKLRAVLAATLSPSWGIYSSYELCERRALPSSEEYQDSEKFELKAWPANAPGNIRSYLAALNQIRRDHSALRLARNLRFSSSSDERVICYFKGTDNRESQLLIAVNLDPYAAHDSVLQVPLASLGIADDETYQVHELLTGERSLWRGPSVHVTLTPDRPASIWRVLRFTRSETNFDYYD